MAYFTGMIANVLPFPGGLGGVEGGMIGALLAFGVDGGLGGYGRARLSRLRVLAADDPGRLRLLAPAPHGRGLGARALRGGIMMRFVTAGA